MTRRYEKNIELPLLGQPKGLIKLCSPQANLKVMVLILKIQ